MPPEPLPWDRKDFFKERKHEMSETTSSSFGGGSTPRWREFSFSSSSNNGSPRDFNRWGPHDFRRPPGHVKQGGWHMLAEESGHVFSPYTISDKMLEDENCRPFSRGDGRYGRNNRENRGYFSQRDWRGGHSWEMINGSPNMPARQRDVNNDQRSFDEMLMYPPSHPAHSEFANSWDHHQLKDQDDNNKMGGVVGLGTDQRGDREIPLDWKPLKWTRSGSLSSRGSGFSHSSSSKSLGGADSNEGKTELQPKNASPVQPPSVDAAACVTSATPSEEVSSRKKARLGWGEGLAKYEKKKVEGPDASENKDGAAVSAINMESIHFLTSNLADKSPRVMGFSDCASPATPSSVACSSSPGLEEKTFLKSTNADNVASNLCGSPSVGSQSHIEGLSFNLEKMDVGSIGNLGSSLAELLQSDDPSSMDSGFMRPTAMNKLLVWKGDLSKALELTESEIDSLENELKSMKFEYGSRCPCPAASTPLFASDVKPCNVQGVASNSVPRPSPLQVASHGDGIVEKVSFCNGGLEVHGDVKDDDIDSPGTATSKFVEPVCLVRIDSSTFVLKNDFDGIQSARMGLKGSVPCADDEETGVFACKDSVPSSGDVISDTNGEDNLCSLILASNKESASGASEVFNKLLPSDQCKFDFSAVTNGSTLQTDDLVVKKIAKRKRLLRFKETAVTLKFKALHHLWKEDMQLLSIRKYRVKSQKKCEPILRTTHSGYQKHRSSIRARLSSPAGNLSLVPTTETLNFTSKLLSDSQVRPYRNALKMPALILDKKEKMVSRFISGNGLVEDPYAVEKERAMINPWTSDEKEIFMQKIATFGKDFRKIASFLDHKSTADCVEFYYKNHKSDCFEKTKKSEQTKTSTNYLMASSTKWNRELNAASLDILGVASRIAADADHAMNSKQLCSGRIFSRGYRSSKITKGDDVLRNERETVAADVLGSLSSEAMSSCITTSVDLMEGYHEWKYQKADFVAKAPSTSDVMQSFDEETCSDESCGEMDRIDWTDEEKSIFIQAVSSYGKDFTMISRVVRTRTRDQCKVFFSKARKCLGLDLMRPGPKNSRTPVGDDASGGGSDTEDACAMGTRSAICSDKLDSKIDEVLPSSILNTDRDESDAEQMIGLHEDLNRTEGNNAPGVLDKNDSKVDKNDFKVVDEMVSDPSEAGQSVDLSSDVNSKFKNAVHQSESVTQKMLIVSANAESERDQIVDKGVSFVESGSVIGAVDVSTSNANTAVELKAVAEVSGNGLENGSTEQKLSLPENSLGSPSGLMQDSTSNASHHPLHMDSCSEFSRGSENMHQVSDQLEPVEKPPVILLPQENNLAITKSMLQDSAVIQFEKRRKQDTLQESNGDKEGKISVSRDDYFEHLSDHPLLSHNESSQILRGYPLQNPTKKEMNGVISGRHLSGAQGLPNPEKKVTSQFEAQEYYLQKCSSLKAQHSVPELPFLSQHHGRGSDYPRDHSRRSPDVEKSCRNGDVKLFGKILTTPLQKQNASAHENGEKEAQHLKPTSKSATFKFTGHRPKEGNMALLKCDPNNQLALENVPMSSYGFWDGNRIQTGFPSMPDSTALLVKYPAAFSNYHMSSSKMPQQTLQAAVKSNERNLNGISVFPSREVTGSNGVVDYQMHRSHDSTGVAPFTVDMKQREDILAEMQRLNGQQPRGMAGVNVVGRGGILVGGACTGVSDPVVAIKRHYAKADQYGGQSGIVFREEESWRGKRDIGR
uniref:SANT domain-containing protein n=1 Tax=Salix viminalis TaxID=40686 RepID=A0A6N2M0Q1_SALVM